MVDRNLRIIFMGTPDFAVPSLRILLEAGYPVVGVITAPDKPGGRGKSQLMISPVKSFALTHGLKVFQPANLKSKTFIQKIRDLSADLQVVVAFRMLPEILWNMPPNGTMNLHASLLPAYRGAAPIQWAIIRGEKTTGLTTFLLQHDIDTGHIIGQREMPILPEDDAGSLHDRMMSAGAGLVIGSVDRIAKGSLQLTPQLDSESSHAPKIDHAVAHLDWHKPTLDNLQLIRAMTPSPGAWTTIDGTELKIFKARVFSDSTEFAPGTIFVREKKLMVQASDGQVELIEVQLSGKRRMSASEFVNGYRIKDWSAT